MSCTAIRKVIIDCDNTFGVPGKPIDDGQAILFLLGREDVAILGITTTFGNSTVDEVHAATCWLMEQLGRSDIPVLRGAAGHQEGETEASRFLRRKAAEFPGEISLVAIGTLANLKQAHAGDSSFFAHLREIVTMGGYLHPLPYKGWSRVKEVNFSGDGEAAWQVFRAECPVVVFNAHICFALPFGLKELAPIAAIDRRQYFIMKELLLASAAHLDDAQDYLWDLLPVLYLCSPELFHAREAEIVSTPRQIEAGYLTLAEAAAPDPDVPETSGSRAEIIMPDYIVDVDRCYALLYEAWAKTLLDPQGSWFRCRGSFPGKKERTPATHAAPAAHAAAKKVIIDAAFLFGLPGERLDQGLALIYLIAQPQVEVLAVTLSKNGGDSAVQADCTAWLLRMLQREDIPLIREAAAEFLAETTAAYPGEVTVICLDGAANCVAAARISEKFCSDAAGAVLLGGRQYPVQMADWDVEDELELLPDDPALQLFLSRCSGITLITMHAAGPFRMNLEDAVRIKEYSTSLYYLVKEYLLSERCMGRRRKPEGFLWSLAPAVYAASPEWFACRTAEAVVGRSGDGLQRIELVSGNAVRVVEYVKDIDTVFASLHAAWAHSPLADSPLQDAGGEARCW